ncbi:MAG TPA: DUF1592 domain-containing protein [Planctomycetota bacterium]
MKTPALVLLCLLGAQEVDLARDYREQIRPLAAKYCLDCHSTKDKKGDLDLERFGTLDDIRKDTRPWLHVVENLENGEMPPKKKPQPTEAERKVLTGWTRLMLEAEARANAGDPGRVVVRRLSNAEYGHTIRDLTGVDLDPARDFPADGAAGEGFTNAGDALVTSPALLAKYLAAAKDVAAHLVLLPDGFRFSPAKTRRDWTDEAVAALRAAYAPYGKDGALPLKPYLVATLRKRDGKSVDPALSPKYLGLLWDALNDPAPSYPLDLFRARWKAAAEKDVDALLAEIAAWQKALFRHHKIGSYGGGKLARAEAVAPRALASQILRVQPKVPPGQDEITLHLTALGLPDAGPVAWREPRFEGKGEILPLRDYASYGARFEIDLPAAFALTEKVLAALDGGPADGLDPAWLDRWREIIGAPGVMAPTVALEGLDTPVPGDDKNPGIRGWRSGDLPLLLSNATDVERHIPGRASPHKVVVHPSPDRFVAVEWRGAAEKVRVEGRVNHAHGGCGNGIAWFLEQRRGDQGARVEEGFVGNAGTANLPARELTLKAGDTLLLAVDARDGSHVCDLTEIDFKVSEGDRVWSLSKDVADTITAGNPHGVWRFVHGPSKRPSSAVKIPPESLLGQWRRDVPRRAELAPKLRALFLGARPGDAKHPDRLLYDSLVNVDGPLFRGIDVSKLPCAKARTFGETPDGLRLPAALFRDHAFVVEPAMDGAPGRAAQFGVSTSVPRVIDADAPVVAPGDAAKRVAAGLDAFRALFPTFVCFPHVIPEDEAVCLKLYHREDEPLLRLFLDEAATRRLERLWDEHRYISRWPETEHKNLPLFIGFVTQDGGAEAVKYFESLREPFRIRAEKFLKDVDVTQPTHVDALVRFAERAWRRPLTADESASLPALYSKLRKKEMPHEEAVRLTLARILTAPAFLFRVEAAAPGSEARPVDAWELASRLSYTLWASMPDDELRRLAADGTLPSQLGAQAVRMLKDPKARGLAVEFAAQWLHARNFRSNREKSETLFPTFNDALRDALFEEVVLVFQDLFRNGRPLEDLLNADFTYLNETLAKHYGIPGVTGAHWRRVDGVRKHGRGGVLTLGAVLAQQSGASRTSPVLRGNWVVDTLLGEKLPKPPANVPQLPEVEGVDGLSVREMTLRHTRVPECATCHVRIDPFGFALEAYDAIGRRRDKAVDTQVTLRDGTSFDGLDGLRGYLLSRKKDLRRTFTRKLLGYALGRSVTLSDQTLLDALDKDGVTLADVVATIVQSPQFLRHRALDATRHE